MERDSSSPAITALYVNLVDQAIEFEDARGTIARVDFSGDTILVEGEVVDLRRSSATTDQVPDYVPAASTGMTPNAASGEAATEKEATVTLAGRLKSTPKPGRPDRSGNPTAWARLAVHDDDRPDAHLYLASFHRHTARIALGLKAGAHITVSGYPHESDNPKRLDTFSVVNIVDNYPGKRAGQD